MATLLEELKGHDWYYYYSDDGRVYRRGQQRSKELTEKIKSLNCPYEMGQLRKAVYDMVLEEFAEESPGRWYRQPHTSSCVAPSRREDLIPLSLKNDIITWIEEQG
tara:strand:+ start:4619 stop:4936 length:318 start_codon:yes stop_codon:yes gene_type:complete